eukprot:761653-Hanusia_phi.AAC.1
MDLLLILLAQVMGSSALLVSSWSLLPSYVPPVPRVSHLRESEKQRMQHMALGRGRGEGAGGGGVRDLVGYDFSSSSSVRVAAAPAEVWRVFSDLERMPKWQAWIDSVDVQPDGTSRWTMRKTVLGMPLSFSWTAQELPREEGRLIQWEATSGVKNRGRVEFEEEEGGREGVRVTMTIEYSLPSIIVFLFRCRWQRRWCRTDGTAGRTRMETER